MAQKTIVTLVDDLTGEEAENINTVEFALDGVTYELDLTDENSTKAARCAVPVCQGRSKDRWAASQRSSLRPSYQKYRWRQRLQPRDAEVDP